MSGRDFPEDAILIARGKYSTIAGERRNALKAMRNDLELLVSCAGRVLRRPDDVEFIREEVAKAKLYVQKIELAAGQIEILHEHLQELKPLAWGEKEPE